MTPHDWVLQATQVMDEWQEQVSYYTGAPVDGFSISQGADGYLLVVRTHSASKGPLVCFYGGRIVGDCFAAFLYDITHGNGPKWKEDRYRR
mgnify:CR=1 FL=1|jgi:hypothetical protein